MTKRICSLLLTLCLIFSLSTFAFATNGAHKTVDYIAQDWIDTQFSGDAEVSDTIVLRSDNSGEVVGYIVSFTKQSVPAGYIVLSCEDGERLSNSRWRDRVFITISNNSLMLSTALLLPAWLVATRMNSYLPPPLLKKMCCIQILFATPSKFQMVLSRHYLTSSRR